MATRKQLTEDDWIALEFEITGLFTGAPIDEEELFAGRQTEVRRILQAVLERSKHVVLYGERGVGKTSLSNIFWKRFNKSLQSFVVARVQAGPADTFSSLWVRALEELLASASTTANPHCVPISADYETITPTEIRRELQKINPNAISILIVDEYNEVLDVAARALTANLIKELYDYSVSSTIIIVGVAENIGRLVEDHQSIGRAIIQVPLSRMTDSELKEIIQKRTSKTVMTFSGDAIWTIVKLSRGLPFFTQTLSKHAALHAIASRHTNVTDRDVEVSMNQFILDTESSFKDAYRDAVQSNQANFFGQSLLACALAVTDEEGFFTANDVVEPYSSIMRDKKRIAHFEKHLRRFVSDERGRILIQRGGERQLRFRFADPMMQPYVIIRGIQSGMIPEEAKSSLLQKEEPRLPI